MQRRFDTPRSALNGLLTACFTPEELRGFFLDNYRHEVNALPVSGSGETFISEAVRVLEQRNLVDARLFQRIVDLRPQLHVFAFECAQQWDVDAPLPASTAGEREPARVGGPLQQGGMLAGYRLVRSLGSGGYGSVWQALAPDGRAVALKILRPDFAHDADCRERFFRGAERMQRVEHPNVVRVHELHRGASGHDFYVMQHVAGDNLHRLCKLGRVPRDSVLKIVAQIADALAACHASGFVHRDVKPENIVVDRHGAPYLADFDFVTLADAAVLSQTRPVGSFGYLAPEVLAGRAPGVEADVYGLGATAVFALGGRDLLAPADLAQQIDALDCSDETKTVLRVATAREPYQRHASMHAFARELRQALSVDPGRRVGPTSGVFVERTDAGLFALFDGRRVALRDLAEAIDMLTAARRSGVVRVQTRGLTAEERELLQRSLTPGRAVSVSRGPEPDVAELLPSTRPWFEMLAGLTIAAAWLGWLLVTLATTFKPGGLVLPLYLSAPCLRVLYDRERRVAVRWLHWFVLVVIGFFFVAAFVPLLLTYPGGLGTAREGPFAIALVTLAHPAAIVASVAYLVQKPRRA